MMKSDPTEPITVPGWNYADVLEVITDTMPDAPAQYHGDLQWTWSEFDHRADGIAKTMLATGVQQQDKVPLYLYNGPEYLQSVYGLFKAGLVPTNTNYRYTDDELVYIWDNADAIAVIFHGTFTDRCEVVRHRLPNVKTWIWADDGTAARPDWAISFEDAATSATGRVTPPWGRTGDDMLFVYTGGTTGMPKGVMWRQDDLVNVLDATNKHRLPEFPDLAAVAARTVKPGPRNLPAAPLMHGTGLFNAMTNLLLGGSIVTMAGHRFDPVELLDTVQAMKVNSMSIVGDAFAKPILRALDAEPDRWDVSSLRVVVSSGVMWSSETKAGLLRHMPRLIMADALGSSEAIGMATNITSAATTAAAAGKTASFELGVDTKILTEEGHEVVPGSGERGRVALRGRTSVGYYKDAAKSASTFIVYHGVRYSIPGDWAEIEADGTVRLLGRGSQCINTGGEKVYPEEVEETLKQYPGVHDAAVVGLPDERFGEAITALVELSPSIHVEPAELIAHVKVKLAAYKAPKQIIFVDSIDRAANGKLDYKTLKARALSAPS